MVTRTILIVILIACLGFVVIEIGSDSPAAILSNLVKKEKLEGSEFIFRIKYFWVIPIGEATFANKGAKAYDEKKVYHLQAQASISPYLASLFKAFIRIDSYTDAEKLHSLAFLVHQKISGKPDEYKEIIYDQKNNIMEFEGTRRLIYPHTQDCLSAIFYLQQQDFHVGKEFSLNINTNQKNYELKVKVLRRDEFEIRDRNIALWVLGATIRKRDGSPRHRSNFTVWLIDNSTKTPVLIKAMTILGQVTAKLVEVNYSPECE